MARAATSDELTLLRRANQRSKIHCAIYNPPVVYSARVNQTVTTTDQLLQITYDGGSGTLANVLPGMTMLVGSSAGARDKGTARIRKTPGATVFYIGETSEINLADNDYITIIDEFAPWVCRSVNPGNVLKMDGEIPYYNQHASRIPLPIMGPLVAAIELSGSSVTFSPTPGASVAPGSTIETYSWAATGPAAVTVANGTTTTPSFTFTQAGWYRLALTVVSASKERATGYRWVYAWDANNPPLACRLDSWSWDAQDGGCDFALTLFSNAGSTVKDNALVVLFAEDWYGDTKQSLGPVAGYENVLAAGWIAGETIDWRPKSGSVKFAVKGLGTWLSQIEGQGVNLKDAHDADPTTWGQIRDLTIDKMLWHLLVWRTTVSTICDCNLTGDTTLAKNLDAPPTNIMEQLKDVAGRICAAPIFDPFGRLFIEIDQQLIAVASRSTIPSVMDVGKADWRESISIDRKINPPAAMMEIEADRYSGTTAGKVYSRAPGNAPKRLGRPETGDNYLVVDQAACDALAGMLLANRNNPYPSIPLRLSNNRMVGVCPRQYLTQSIATGDTPREIIWTTCKLIVRHMELIHNAKTGQLHTEIDAEAETSGPDGISYYPPNPPRQNIPTVPTTPDFPLGPGGDPYFPPVIPPADPGLGDCKANPNADGNGPYQIYFSPQTINAGGSAYAQFPCWIRVAGASFPTIVRIALDLQGSISDLTLSAVNNAHAPLAVASTGSMDLSGLYEFQFAPEPGVSVAGFLLENTSSETEIYTKGDLISSGSLDGGPSGGTPYHLTGLTVGNWYCIESSGGPIYQDGDLKYASYYIKADLDASMAGAMGTVNGGWIDNVPPWISYAERVLPNYYRFFWRATQTGLYLWAGDESFGDNPPGYSLSFSLFNATVNQANIKNAWVYNVCKA